MAKQILVVEDDEAIRMTFSEILKMEGYDVIEAENGQVGIDLLAKGVRPQLILLDLMMPVKDGFQFRQEQIANSEWAEIPTVVLSADGNLGEKISQMGGKLASIKKPPDLDTVVSVVEKYCAKK